MDLAERDEERLLRETVRGMFADLVSADRVREIRERPDCFDSELWPRVVGLDVLTMLAAPPHGLGLGLAAGAAVAEEAGRVLAAVPIASSLVAGWLVDGFGSEAQREQMLGALAAGEVRYTVSAPARDGEEGPPLRAVSTDPWILTGRRTLVRDAVGADEILCVVPLDDSGAVTIVVRSNDPGVRITPQRTAGLLREGVVELSEVRVPADRVLPGRLADHDLARLLALQVILEGAELGGACSRVLDLATRYAASRQQFGRPIGSFQSVQHRLVDALLDLDGLVWLTRRAATAFDTGAEDAVFLAACLGVVLSSAPRRILAAAHQVHGGVGFVRDHSLPMYFGRERAAALTVGPLRVARERIARQLFDTGSPPDRTERL
jgi:alkylation response protein AidB-like acyl-CoA dehydrogenase